MAKKKEVLSDEEFAKRYKEFIKDKKVVPITKEEFEKEVKKIVTTKKLNDSSLK